MIALLLASCSSPISTEAGVPDAAMDGDAIADAIADATIDATMDATIDAIADATADGGKSYSTSFQGVEDPISENGVWTTGKVVGLDWQDPRKENGFGFGAGLSAGYD